MAVVVATPQPVLELSALQSLVVPPVTLTVQPGEVWRVTESVVSALTPSIMSISPLEGQFGPKDQNAGQVLLNSRQ